MKKRHSRSYTVSFKPNNVFLLGHPVGRILLLTLLPLLLIAAAVALLLIRKKKARQD